MSYFDNLGQATTLIHETRMDYIAWDEIESDAMRTACLFQAFNRIYYSKEFTGLPAPGHATPQQLVRLRLAQAEFAFYLAIHASDEDRRKGLQAQGVIKAGVVKEDYEKELLKITPIPPFVFDLLDEYVDKGREFGAVDLCRDDNVSVNTDVCDF